MCVILKIVQKIPYLLNCKPDIKPDTRTVVKKEDMTGSIVAIKSEELNRGAVVSTQDMLKGSPGIWGLKVLAPDGKICRTSLCVYMANCVLHLFSPPVKAGTHGFIKTFY